MTGALPRVPRCAILFATPVTREEFDAAVLNGRSDFIAELLGDDDPETVWSEHFLPVATAAQHLIETAECVGASVRRSARLSDLAEATASYDCVILLAHWRGAFFSLRDLMGNAEGIRERIDQKQHATLSYFRPAPPTAAGLVDAFNNAIKQRSLLAFAPPRVADIGRTSPAIGEALCRDLMDAATSGLAEPGNRLELSDGFHTMGAINAAVSDKFRGELDLGTCHSEALATFLDLRRGNQFRHIHWPVSIHPEPQYMLIRATLRRLARAGGSYILTRLGIERDAYVLARR